MQKLYQKHVIVAYVKIPVQKPIDFHISPSMEVTGDQICSQANQRLLVKETAVTPRKFIAYYRVSTIRQGESGLGLDAQKASTATYLAAISGTLSLEFTEVESGKVANRPKLTEAIETCRRTGATLLIAKLDRLARNVAFIANLLESGVSFTAIDMPNADKFMLHVYAAVAEEEGRRISERTKAALSSAKARGVKLGVHGIILSEKNRKDANRFASSFKPILNELLVNENLSFRNTAIRLNELGLPTARGRKWHSTSVHRLWNRIQKINSPATAP